MSPLKRHPFAVEAFFESSLVLTFAVPAAEAAALLPPCLVPDTWQQQWAFVAVALVQTQGLRPAGLPAWLGRDFFLVGYRVFVRYTTVAGKRLRGLYILKSETDSPLMTLAGNCFTHYRYTTIDVDWQSAADGQRLASRRADLRIRTGPPAPEVALPPGSPFATWAEARRFAGPLPFTFTYDAPSRTVLLVEGVREYWQPQPVAVAEQHVGFLQTLGFSAVQLASAFLVENIPYHWRKGRTELWPH